MFDAKFRCYIWCISWFVKNYQGLIEGQNKQKRGLYENPKDKEKYHSEANLFPKPVGFQLRPTTGEFRRQLNHKWSDSRRA